MASVNFYINEHATIFQDETGITGSFHKWEGGLDISNQDNITAAEQTLNNDCDITVIVCENGNVHERMTKAFNCFFKVIKQNTTRPIFDWYAEKLYSPQNKGADRKTEACLSLLNRLVCMYLGIIKITGENRIKIDVSTKESHNYCFGFHTDRVELENLLSSQGNCIDERFSSDLTMEKIGFTNWGYYVYDFPASVICKDIVTDFCLHLALLEKVSNDFNLDIATYNVNGID